MKRPKPLITVGRAIVVLCLLFLLWVMVLRPISPRLGSDPIDLQDGWQLSAPSREGIDEAALLNAIERLLDAPLNVHSVLVERHGHLLAEYYQGGKDRSVYGLISMRRSLGPSDRHDVRSIGKSVTSLLYGIALQQGKVPAVSASVFDAYPELSDLALADKQGITIESLLNMASGLQWQEGGVGLNDELSLFWKSDIARYVLSHGLAVAPNTMFNYNGGGTAILADLISRGTGQALDVYARAQLFEPMGIEDWEWVGDLHGRPMAFNGLRLRPRDLLKLGRLVLNQGQWHGRQLVPKAWIENSMTPLFDTDVRNYRYAYQWWSGTADWHGRSLPWHAGFGNGGQRLYVVPELDLAVVTLAGAYDETPTAIRVSDLIQEIVNCVKPPQQALMR
jgi:CubicO group peptidase (beta-lactamase class C family)